MHTNRQFDFVYRSGMSLIEVLLAVGLCAAVLVTVLAMWGPSVRGSREVADRRVAMQLVDGVASELSRIGFRAAATGTLHGSVIELVATADGSRVILMADAERDPLGSEPRGIQVSERYFHIEATRILHPTAESAVLPLQIRVSWPFTLPPAGDVVPASARSDYRTIVALNP
jgi:type II secretory pathway pseudopilin PulG